jgi:hypothetical protein
MSRNGEKWSEDEEQQLIHAMKQKKTIPFLAEQHQRSQRAIQMRLEYIVKKMSKTQSLTDISTLLHVDVATLKEWMTKKESDQIQHPDHHHLTTYLKQLDQRLQNLEQLTEKIYKRIKTQEKR